MESVKKELCTTPTLAWYDATKPLIISADASSYGLGATLLQEEVNGDRTHTPRDRSQTVDSSSRAEVVGSTTIARAAIPSQADALLVRHQLCSGEESPHR